MSTRLWRIDTISPDRGVIARHVKVILKNTVDAAWRIDTIRLIWSRKTHVLPRWLIPVNRLLRRTKVTLKNTVDAKWRIDQIRLKQMIRRRRPQI